MNTENIATEVLDEINKSIIKLPDETIQVVINVADDLKGAWTNFYVTDFDSKFKLNALVTRNFCTPYFWSSENYDETKITNRIMESAWRTIYWKTNPRPRTLNDFIAQEQFVAIKTKNETIQQSGTEEFNSFLEVYGDEDDYNVLFNFFYGDEACESLGYPTYGLRRTDIR